MCAADADSPSCLPHRRSLIKGFLESLNQEQALALWNPWNCTAHAPGRALTRGSFHSCSPLHDELHRCWQTIALPLRRVWQPALNRVGRSTPMCVLLSFFSLSVSFSSSLSLSLPARLACPPLPVSRSGRHLQGGYPMGHGDGRHGPTSSTHPGPTAARAPNASTIGIALRFASHIPVADGSVCHPC